MISLRIPFRRAYIAGFWITLFSVVAISVGALSAAMQMAWWWAWGVGTGSCLVVAGFLWKPWFEYGVKAWNRGTPILTAILRSVVVRLCFCLIFAVGAPSGSALRIASVQGSKSMWHALALASYRLELAGSGTTTGGGWLSELLTFARRPGNRWMLLLVPFLFTLVLLGDEQKRTVPPTSTYTLF
jgi:hypothetical protein